MKTNNTQKEALINNTV